MDMKNKFFDLKEKNLFNINFTLEEKTFLLVALSGILMSAIGFIGNILLGLSILTLIIPAVNIIIDVTCLLYFYKTRKYKILTIIVIMYALFVLFPMLWFSTGGATGSTMPFVVLMGIFIVIAFEGKFRTIIMIVVICLYTAFTFIELKYPGIYIPYPDRRSHYMDLSIGMIISYSVSSYLAYQVLNSYKQAKNEAESLISKLEISSMIDSLTGIYNRRYLTSCISEEMRKSYDDGSNLVLCIIDVDFFKVVNDTYGHIFGDKILVELSKTISSLLSKDEIFGRYGGEEFVIIFRNCTVEMAIEKLNIIYAELKKAEWNKNINLTVSCGVTSYTKGVSFSKFLEQADKNLYIAKEKGRNLVIY